MKFIIILKGVRKKRINLGNFGKQYCGCCKVKDEENRIEYCNLVSKFFLLQDYGLGIL